MTLVMKHFMQKHFLILSVFTLTACYMIYAIDDIK